MNSRIKKSKKGEQICGPKGLHFVQNASRYITGEDKCYITLNNKAYMLASKRSESRRLKRVPIGIFGFLPTL